MKQNGPGLIGDGVAKIALVRVKPQIELFFQMNAAHAAGAKILAVIGEGMDPLDVVPEQILQNVFPQLLAVVGKGALVKKRKKAHTTHGSAGNKQNQQNHSHSFGGGVGQKRSDRTSPLSSELKRRADRRRYGDPPSVGYGKACAQAWIL